MPRSGARILLLGGDADHNVGDRAILSAIVHCMRAHAAAAEISVVGEPGVVRSIPGIARSIRRGWRGIAALKWHALRADRVLIAGGGLFQDDDSRVKMPYWAARIALLRVLNSRIIGHSIGAGPLDHTESRIAALTACAAMTSISVRDPRAREALAGCTSRPIAVVPDPAFMLDPAPPAAAAELLRSLDLQPGRPLIVATVRHWFHARGGFVPNALKIRAGFKLKRDDARFASLLDTLADSLVRLARRLDSSVLLLPGYNVGHEADDVACESLARRLDGVVVRLARVTDPRLYKAILGHASLVIASRMHPLILAAGMGVPFVGLSYNQKFEGLYELLDLKARPLPLDAFPLRWGSRELVAAAESALDAKIDLRHRADLLGNQVWRQTIAVAFGEMDVARAGAADA